MFYLSNSIIRCVGYEYIPIGGHSDIVRVRLDGTTDKAGLVDAHRSRLLLREPKK